MRRLFRPSLLIALSAAAVVGAAAVVFQSPAPHGRPMPLPVAGGDREIVWLYPATDAAAWARFVAAVRRAGDRLHDEHPDLTVSDSAIAFPPQTTATPEIALAWTCESRRLVFRWYKLTSDWKIGDWIEALLTNRPPPLAIIGGNTSDVASELACKLRKATVTLPEADRPLLLLTTATADRVPEMKADAVAPYADSSSVIQTSPIGLYSGRSFRFCFTNQQMADAVTQFIWKQDDLRPDSDPVHIVRWHDDLDSNDLMAGYLDALQRLATREAVADWMWVTGCFAHGGLSGLTAGGFPLRRAGMEGSSFRMSLLPTPQLIDSSVGTFLTPNRFEAQAAANLLDLALSKPQRRPLLVVPARAMSCRRFLRALARLAPDYARRFVVATGDALPFNTVYRDRQVAWPVQDLPFSLVFFCHYDPVDPEAGFRYHRELSDPTEASSSITGTEDILLDGSIVEAVAQAFHHDGIFSPDASDLALRLEQVRLYNGRLGFDPLGRLFFHGGNRRTGTGEHVVHLQPYFDGERVLPQASIDVWTRHADRATGPVWERRREPLIVSYDDKPPDEESAP